jgi:hypothetical protein
MHVSWRLVLVASLVLAAVGSLVSADAPAAEAPDARALPTAVPSPALTPEEVVGTQLAALSANVAIPERIAACYRFASPANRNHTGPLERFAQLFASPKYRVMLDARSFLIGKAIRHESEAYLLVTMVDGRGELSLFRFFLTKESKPPYADCWMTDSVIRLEPLTPPEPPSPEKTPAI